MFALSKQNATCMKQTFQPQLFKYLVTFAKQHQVQFGRNLEISEQQRAVVNLPEIYFCKYMIFFPTKRDKVIFFQDKLCSYWFLLLPYWPLLTTVVNLLKYNCVDKSTKQRWANILSENMFVDRTLAEGCFLLGRL